MWRSMPAPDPYAAVVHPVKDILYLPRMHAIVVMSSGSVDIWSAFNGKFITGIPLSDEAELTACVVDEREVFLAIGRLDGILMFIHLGTRKQITSTQISDSEVQSLHIDHEEHLLFVLAGSKMVVIDLTTLDYNHAPTILSSFDVNYDFPSCSLLSKNTIVCCGVGGGVNIFKITRKSTQRIDAGALEQMYATGRGGAGIISAVIWERRGWLITADQSSHLCFWLLPKAAAPTMMDSTKSDQNSPAPSARTVRTDPGSLATPRNVQTQQSQNAQLQCMVSIHLGTDVSISSLLFHEEQSRLFIVCDKTKIIACDPEYFHTAVINRQSADVARFIDDPYKSNDDSTEKRIHALNLTSIPSGAAITNWIFNQNEVSCLRAISGLNVILAGSHSGKVVAWSCDGDVYGLLKLKSGNETEDEEEEQKDELDYSDSEAVGGGSVMPTPRNIQQEVSDNEGIEGSSTSNSRSPRHNRHHTEENDNEEESSEEESSKKVSNVSTLAQLFSGALKKIKWAFPRRPDHVLELLRQEMADARSSIDEEEIPGSPESKKSARLGTTTSTFNIADTPVVRQLKEYERVQDTLMRIAPFYSEMLSGDVEADTIRLEESAGLTTRKKTVGKSSTGINRKMIHEKVVHEVSRDLC